MPKAKYRLHANRVDRIAIVDKPAVPDAEILLFKRLNDSVSGNANEVEGLTKGATSFQNLPLTDRDRAWDASAAGKRVKQWAGGGDSLEDMDWGKYRKAFMWYDSEAPDKLGSYKLGYADIVDGNLKAVPRAVFAIVQVLAGGRGGVNIPTEDKKKVLNHCKRYYKKMDVEFPDVSIKFIEKAIEPDFKSRAFPYMMGGAVEGLGDVCWGIIHSDKSAEERIKIFKREYKIFSEVVVKMFEGIVKEKQVANELTTQDILTSFEGDLTAGSVYSSLSSLHRTLQGIFYQSDSIEDVQKTVKEVLKSFETHIVENVLKSADTVEKVCQEVEAILKGEGTGYELLATPEAWEKVGRKISSARMKKLKEALKVLADMIEETEVIRDTKKEAEDMKELQEVLKKLEGFSADVGGLIERIGAVETVLKANGMPLTEEGKQEVEANKRKEREDADTEKRRLEKESWDKRREAVGLKEGATHEDIEKLEGEEKAKTEKFQAELPGRLEQFDKAIKRFDSFVGALEKRFGMKTSIDKSEGQPQSEGEDVFGKALK